MKSITIHGLDDSLDRIIREKAKIEGTSLNKTIKKLLRKSLGVSGKSTIKSDFSEFLGVWSKQDFEKFEKAAKILKKLTQTSGNEKGSFGYKCLLATFSRR